MKLQPDQLPSQNMVTRYDTEFLEINAQRYNNSILLMPDGPVLPWLVSSWKDLNRSHFTQIANQKPELVIFGSGSKIRFLDPSLLQDLIQLRIGFETMDTPAACRTYNILMGEGRLVLGAFLMEQN
ncbi:MAG: Mth938-like domain-containing protein [Burkholderiales bacterium]|nr:Mth938-like domain-containing protein [Burkholderiales bacterium]